MSLISSPFELLSELGLFQVTDKRLLWTLCPLHATCHEAGKHCHHHLRLDLHQVLRQRVYPGTNLPGHRDSVPDNTVRQCQVPSLLKQSKVIYQFKIVCTYFALLSFSSSVRSSAFTRSYLIDPGCMASIRSRTGILLPIEPSYTKTAVHKMFWSANVFLTFHCWLLKLRYLTY